MLYTLSVQGCLAIAPAIRSCCLGRVFALSTTAFTLADRGEMSARVNAVTLCGKK